MGSVGALGREVCGFNMQQFFKPGSFSKSSIGLMDCIVYTGVVAGVLTKSANKIKKKIIKIST